MNFPAHPRLRDGLMHQTGGASQASYLLVAVMVGMVGVAGFSTYGTSASTAIGGEGTDGVKVDDRAAPMATSVAAGTDVGSAEGVPAGEISVEGASAAGAGIGKTLGIKVTHIKPPGGGGFWGAVGHITAAVGKAAGQFAVGFVKGLGKSVWGAVTGLVYMVNPYHWDDIAKGLVYAINPAHWDDIASAIGNAGGDFIDAITSGDFEAIGEAFGQVTGQVLMTMAGGGLANAGKLALVSKFPQVAEVLSKIPVVSRLVTGLEETSQVAGLVAGKFTENLVPALRYTAGEMKNVMANVALHPVQTLKGMASEARSGLAAVKDAVTHPIESFRSVTSSLETTTAEMRGLFSKKKKPDLEPPASSVVPELPEAKPNALPPIEGMPHGGTYDHLETAMADTEDWLMSRGWTDPSTPRSVDLLTDTEAARGVAARPGGVHENRPGWTDVDTHGSPGSVIYGENTRLTGEQLHQVLIDNGYRGGPVRVLACNSGTCPVTGNPVIQDLANATGYPVIGPTDTVAVTPGGRVDVIHSANDVQETVTEEAWRVALPEHAAPGIDVPSGERLTSPEIQGMRETRPRFEHEPIRGSESHVNDPDLATKVRGADQAILNGDEATESIDIVIAANTTARELRPGGRVVIRDTDHVEAAQALHEAGFEHVRRVNIGDGDYAITATKPTSKGLRQDDWITPEMMETMDPETVFAYSEAPEIPEIWLAPVRTTDPWHQSVAGLDTRTPALRSADVPGIGDTASTAESRAAALRQTKRDLGIPNGQQPTRVTTVPLTDSNGKQILDANFQPISTREYTFRRPDGTDVVVQEHAVGHAFDQGGVGDQGPHFNVRPPENTRTGKVPGTSAHYPFATSATVH